MNLLARIKNICLNPKAEWPVIAAETQPINKLVLTYILPLAGMGAVAGFIGSTLIGQSLPFLGTYRLPFLSGLNVAVFTLIMAIVAAFIQAFVINSLAPTFGGEKNSLQAFKLACYAYTPAWVAGILSILPSLGIVAILAGFYGLYLLYLGLPLLMKSDTERSLPYTIVVVISAIALSIVINLMATLMVGSASSMMSSVVHPSKAEVEFDQDSPIGKLQNFSKQMEAASEKMEQVDKNASPEQQMQVAVDSLAKVLGGGKKVEPLSIDQLKQIMPETLLGLAKTSNSAEKNGAMGINISKATAKFGQGAKFVDLEISDMGGASGLWKLADWVNVESEKQDQFGSESTRKINGRMVHEKSSASGTEYSLVIAERFLVKATAKGVALNDLKAEVDALALDKLEAAAK